MGLTRVKHLVGLGSVLQDTAYALNQHLVCGTVLLIIRILRARV